MLARIIFHYALVDVVAVGFFFVLVCDCTIQQFYTISLFRDMKFLAPYHSSFEIMRSNGFPNHMIHHLNLNMNYSFREQLLLFFRLFFSLGILQQKLNFEREKEKA